MKLILDHKKPEALDCISFYFRPEVPLTWQAGQYLHYTLAHPNPDARKTERYFTVSAAPHEGFVMITTRFAGVNGSSFKKALLALKPGDAIEAEGPEGEFTLDNPTRPAVFIAGGIGITPYRAILLDLDHRGKPLNVTLLYANRTDDPVYQQELAELAARHPEFRIRYFIGDRRIDAAAIKEISPDLQRPMFYVSGPEPMVQAFVKLFRELGIPDERQKRDFFPGYDWP